MKRLARSGLLLAAACALAACSSAASPEKIAEIKPSMKVDQVKAILGQPAHIDQSEMTGLRGEVYHYPSGNGEGMVIFLNDRVFKAEYVAGGKSS